MGWGSRCEGQCEKCVSSWSLGKGDLSIIFILLLHCSFELLKGIINTFFLDKLDNILTKQGQDPEYTGCIQKKNKKIEAEPTTQNKRGEN